MAKAPAYLQDAAQHWLFGSLATEGIPVPKTWTPRALLLAVLGLSKAHVLARLETQLRAQVGPAAARRIQQLGGAALTLWQPGPAGLWQDLTAHTGALLPQALGAVQGRLTQLLATGVARLLVKLALPGGALVQVLQSGYDAYETLVARARELAQVGRTLFALAGSLAQGAVAPAAQALEAVLARLLPVVLDFLARTFGLDQLPRLLRLGLEALRRPIDKGLDWVLGHLVQLAKNAGQGVKQGGAAAAQAGQQAIEAVENWLELRQPFKLANGEQHTLFFEKAGGYPELMMASDPQKKRNIIVDALVEELRSDVQAMLMIVQQHPAAWADIDGLAGLSPAQKKILKERVRRRIEQGEREIAAQPMAALRN